MTLFKRKYTLQSGGNIKRLAGHLQKLPQVNRYDGQDHNEAWALARTFADLEQEFRDFLADDLPKLIKLEGEELRLHLIGIGVGLQHILYHVIENQKFYQYLVPPGTKVFGDPDEADSYTAKFPPDNFPL